jgi:cytochrome c oxidase assembly factor CtaG/cytochrome c2
MWMIGIIAAGTLTASSAPALAHSGVTSASNELHWPFDPAVMVALALGAIGYGLGWSKLSTRRAHVIGHSWHVIAFWIGFVIVAAALQSPLEPIADQLLSMHMVQHLLLILVAAPLLVLGSPAAVLLWALPRRGRRRLTRAWSACGGPRLLKAVSNPALIWALFSGAFVFWHTPGPYRWGAHNELAHACEHLSFLATAMAFWAIVLAPASRRRLGYGPSILYVASAAVISGLPGALMIFAPRPLYDLGDAAARWNLTPLQDQQLAGLLMWIPMDAFYFAVCGWLFLRWLMDGERRTLSQFSSIGRSASTLVVLAFVLAGCGQQADSDTAENQLGDVKHGAILLDHYGCGSCHAIPGIADAQGDVGPPLTRISRRVYIAGLLRNSPDNMEQWLMHPQRIAPGNAMPDMQMPESDARDITAFLMTLK